MRYTRRIRNYNFGFTTVRVGYKNAINTCASGDQFVFDDKQQEASALQVKCFQEATKNL